MGFNMNDIFLLNHLETQNDVSFLGLTQGQVTQLDYIDWEYFKQWKWNAVWSPGSKSFYVRRGKWDPLTKKETKLSLHREIMARYLGRNLLKTEIVDHINHDTLDNRRASLRIAIGSQSQQNRGKHIDNTSGYKGVTFHKHNRKFVSSIQVNGKRKWLGYFADAISAAKAL